MSSEQPLLRVRINQIDSTVVKAGPLDDSTLPRAPVLRVYGQSSLGRKVCLHIHQVYPYFFVEYGGQTDPVSVNRYITRLMHSLNHAIAVSLKRNPNSPNSRFIRAIVLVKGVQFYGFHSSYTPFLKVLINDPAYVRRAVNILQTGSVMKTRFRTYESHLSYILQFLCDFGLYGCGWLSLSDAFKRSDNEIDEDDMSTATFKTSSYPREGPMPFEFDTAGYHILNRHNLAARNLHHELKIPGNQPPSEPLVISARELWEDERHRRAAKGLTPSPALPKDLSANSRCPDIQWVAEARWWEEIRKRIERERDQDVPLPSGAEWEKWVMTTFESVQALWNRPWRTWKPDLQKPTIPIRGNETTEDNPYAVLDSQEGNGEMAESADQDLRAEVDEDVLSSQDIRHLDDDVQWDPVDVQQDEDDMPDDTLANGEGNLTESPAPRASPTKSEPRTPTKGSAQDSDKSSAFHRAWSKLMKPTHTRFPSVVSETDSPLRPATSLLEENPKYASQYGPIYDSSPENPFLEQTFAMNDVTPTHDTKIHMLQKQLTGSAKHLRHSSGTPRSQSDEATSDTTDDSEDEPRKAEQYRLHESLTAENVDYDLEEEVERAQKRLKVAHEPEDDNPFAPSRTPEGSVAPPRYMRPVEQITASHAALSLSLRTMSNCYEYSLKPPSTAEIVSTFGDSDLPSKLYRAPYYAVESDAPDHPREYAGLVYHLRGGDGLDTLDEWTSASAEESLDIIPNYDKASGSESNIWGWQYAASPPSVRQVRRWLTERGKRKMQTKPKDPSQIDGPTQANPYGMRPTLNPQNVPSVRQEGNMEVLAIEVFAPSITGKLPDPAADEVVVVFWSIYDSDSQNINQHFSSLCQAGIIAVNKQELNSRKIRGWSLDVVDTELELLNRVVDIVQDLDPDIIVGWDVQTSSLGYLDARAKSYDFNLAEQLSRAPGRTTNGGTDQWGAQTTTTFKIVGRHVLNLWRVIRAEQNFTTYTFEYTVFQILRKRTPHYSPHTLTSWYYSSIPEHVSRLLRYFTDRTSMVLEIIDVAQIVTKTAEFARIFGVDFFSVLSRGSQFKVESFMFRIAKPESFVLLSPSRQDVGRQNAAECMPLIMEPLSAFYNSPLLVLDFQSLYPSVMIAYNYCYSTCIGRVVDFKGQNKFGVTELHQPPGLLEKLKDHVNVAPNGMVYVKPEVRKGLLARMLTELLDTRVMVKQAMKVTKDDKALQRVLDARQLGLKFIANVTYGYTSATFSGRMPAVEVADSIVQSGRETLEKAIRVIDSTKKWGAKVVYGDTDSVFVYLIGKTKEQAFRIGQDIADTITAMNPAPVKLKFEKVYLPCVLLAKKRYVGFKFENPDDKEPVFDAKGIETVRRDGVPAQQKMVETCLKILFRTQDLSRVKEYCCDSWSRMLENRISPQDFIFAKEVKMGTYSDKVPPPPGVAVAARRMVEDSGYEPQYGERVPYVIIRGKPLERLVDRAVAPEEVLNDSHKYIDASYYISRVLIPPLERIFNLVGADVRSWYDDMPKALRADQPDAYLLSPRKVLDYVDLANRVNIDGHFLASRCLTCSEPTSYGVCMDCRTDEQPTIARLLVKVGKTESKLKNVHRVCSSCSGNPVTEPIQCDSLDCPWLFERKKIEHKAEALSAIEEYVEEVQEGVYPCSDSDSEKSYLFSNDDEEYDQELVEFDSDQQSEEEYFIVEDDSV